MERKENKWIFFKYFKTNAFPPHSIVILVHFLVFHVFISLYNILIKFIFRCWFVFCCVWSFGSSVIVVIFLCLCSHCLEQKGVIDTKGLLLSVPATSFSQSGYVDSNTTEFWVKNLNLTGSLLLWNGLWASFLVQ